MGILYHSKLIKENYYPVVAEYVTIWSNSIKPDQNVCHYAQIMYSPTGKCCIRIEAEEIALSGGKVLLMDSDVPYSIVNCSDDLELFRLLFVFEKGNIIGCTMLDFYKYYDSFRRFYALEVKYIDFNDDDGMLCYALISGSKYQTGIYENKKKWHSLNLFFCLAVIFRMINTDSEKKTYGNTKYVRQALRYIHEHYAQNIHAKDIAENIGLNTCYMHRVFSNEIGVSINTYINQYRINKATNMLAHTSISIQSIAQMIGIKNQQYFSNIYKKYTGNSPLNYRNTYKIKWNNYKDDTISHE